jgi:hypothetical protein
VLIDDQKATDTAYYTWDEGLTYESVKFTHTPFEVENVIIEPTNTGQHFMIYGSGRANRRKVGMISALDFSSLHKR